MELDHKNYERDQIIEKNIQAKNEKDLLAEKQKDIVRKAKLKEMVDGL